MARIVWCIAGRRGLQVLLLRCGTLLQHLLTKSPGIELPADPAPCTIVHFWLMCVPSAEEYCLRLRHTAATVIGTLPTAVELKLSCGYLPS